MWNCRNVSTTEVKRICCGNNLRDWTQHCNLQVSVDEADVIQNLVGGHSADIPVEAFRNGLRVELKHWTRFPDAHITNNHPILTGKIVLAHLK